MWGRYGIMTSKLPINVEENDIIDFLSSEGAAAGHFDCHGVKHSLLSIAGQKSKLASA